MYDLLREISVYADNYDDEFIEKYKAEFYKESSITPLSEMEKEAVWQQISDILEDYNNYSLFFKEKRWNDFQWDIIVISLLKIVNILLEWMKIHFCSTFLRFLCSRTRILTKNATCLSILVKNVMAF